MTARISIHILDMSRGERLAELATLLQLNYMLLIIDDTFNSLKTEGKSDVTLSYNNIYPHAKKYFLPLLYLPPPSHVPPPPPSASLSPGTGRRPGGLRASLYLLGCALSMQGRMKKRPGPEAPPFLSRPSRNMTARSYSCTTCNIGFY